MDWYHYSLSVCHFFNSLDSNIYNRRSYKGEQRKMTTLLTIIHDPQGKQLSHLSSELFSLFDNSFMIATEETYKDLLYGLSLRCILEVKPAQGMCQARRDVVELAWEHDPMAEQYFYCDFDRLLFWYQKFPDELKKVIEMRSQFMVLGRTDEAMSTYPSLQYETERAMNRIIRLRHSFNYDFFAGARLFSPAISRFLIDYPGEDAQLDVHWPIAVSCRGIDIDYLTCDGLAYEAEFLDMTREPEDEANLRVRNLRSILDYVREK
jgi:hypothetical protein